MIFPFPNNLRHPFGREREKEREVNTIHHARIQPSSSSFPSPHNANAVYDKKQFTAVSSSLTPGAENFLTYFAKILDGHVIQTTPLVYHNILLFLVYSACSVCHAITDRGRRKFAIITYNIYENIIIYVILFMREMGMIGSPFCFA